MAYRRDTVLSQLSETDFLAGRSMSAYERHLNGNMNIDDASSYQNIKLR